MKYLKKHTCRKRMCKGRKSCRKSCRRKHTCRRRRSVMKGVMKGG